MLFRNENECYGIHVRECVSVGLSCPRYFHSPDVLPAQVSRFCRSLVPSPTSWANGAMVCLDVSVHVHLPVHTTFRQSKSFH